MPASAVRDCRYRLCDGAFKRASLAAAFFAAALSSWYSEAIESTDGRWRIESVDGGAALELSRGEAGAPVYRIEIIDRQRQRGRVAALIDAPPRQSFFVLLRDIPEAWEIVYRPGAAPAFDGLVHDYRMNEAVAPPLPLPLPRRRIWLDAPLREIDGATERPLFAPSFEAFVMRANASLHVVHVDVRRRIETLPASGDPRTATGASWSAGGRTLFAMPDPSRPVLHVIDGRTWRHCEHAIASPAYQLQREGKRLQLQTQAGVVTLDAAAILCGP